MIRGAPSAVMIAQAIVVKPRFLCDSRAGYSNLSNQGVWKYSDVRVKSAPAEKPQDFFCNREVSRIHMKKNRPFFGGRAKWIGAICLVLALVAGLVALFRPREPRFEGRSLTYWAARLNQVEAQRALTAIGTNALPFLIEWLSEEPTLLDSWMWKAGEILPDSLRPNPWPFGSRRDIAGNALGFLGTNAIPAIPELVRTFDWNWAGGSPPRNQYALAEIGPAAIPALLQALNQDPERTHFVVGTLVYMSYPHRMRPRTADELRVIVGGMEQILADPNESVRLEAASCLMLLDQDEIQEEVQALWAKLLQDESVSIRLIAVEDADHFPPDSPMLDLVANLLNDPDPAVRLAAERALKKAGRLVPPPVEQSKSGRP